MRGYTYENNHLIMQTVEEENAINYTTEKATVLVHIFSQTYSLMRGINKFGDKFLDTVLSEVNKLHDRTCFRPVDVNIIINQ